jgi:peptidoglycan/LPS O-acetylase OafA/YrhL
MLLGLRRFGLATTLAIVLALQLAFRVYVMMRYGTGYTDSTFVLPWSVAGRLSEFALGMAAALIVSRGGLSRLPSWQRRSLPLLMLLGFAAALWCKGHVGVIHPLTDLLWSAAFLAFLLTSSQGGTWLNRLVSGRWLVRLGICSYSVYLVHELVLSRIMTRALLMPQFRAHPLLAMPIVLIPTLVSGYVFYRLIERPAIEYFSRRRRRRASVEASAPSA